jgi:hypothetical protein
MDWFSGSLDSLFLTTETLRHREAGRYQNLKSLNSRGGAETAEKTFSRFHCAATSALLRVRINRGKILLKALAKTRNASDLHYREAIYSGGLCRVA